MSARVLIIGAGGLGGPAAIAVASAGAKHVTLLDDDVVDDTNLGRQVLFGDDDVGRAKAPTAARALRQRFPGLDARAIEGRFGRDDASLALLLDHDVVIDGTDNFATRFAANDLCVRAGRPLVHGAALMWRGQMLVIRPGETPCLRCVFEDEPPPGAAPTCAQAGVIAPLVGLVGRWMGEAAGALLRGADVAEAGSMRVIEALDLRERLIPLGRDPACAACGPQRGEP